jgi:pectinesterase
MARDLCIRNTAGGPADHQAVAFFSESDHSVLYRCDIQGFQDALLANAKLQFYRDCRIWGTVDFVFGNAAAVFQSCELYARRPADPRQHDVITAQGREDHSGAGFVFQGCTVAPSALPGEGLAGGVQTYLGRPWRHHAQVVFMGCSIDPIVHADGWVSWNKDKQFGGEDPTPDHQNHTFFAEYDNRLLGSANKVPVHWRGFTAISRDEAKKFTARRFIRGDEWIPQTGVPYRCGL